MKKIKVFLIILAFTCCKQEKEIQKFDKEPFVIGEKINVFSKVLNENRKINIYLPNGYKSDSDKSYPVIYLLDGSEDEDFIHVSGLVQFCSFSWINIIPESIVVGISNVDRKRDFTYPSNNKLDKKEFPTHGGSQKFIQFLETELQPLIDSNYKVNSKKTLIGQSLGGLLATEIVFKKPELFDYYIIVSPSMWWDEGSLLNEKMKPINVTKSIYVAVGKEGEGMERGAKLLYEKIKEESNMPNLYFHFLEKQSHGDALHLAVYDAFEKMNKKP